MASSSTEIIKNVFIPVFSYDFLSKKPTTWCGTIVKILPYFSGHFPAISRIIGVARMAWYASRHSGELENIQAMPGKLFSDHDLFRGVVEICRGAIEFTGYAPVTLPIVDIIGTIFKYFPINSHPVLVKNTEAVK